MNTTQGNFLGKVKYGASATCFTVSLLRAHQPPLWRFIECALQELDMLEFAFSYKISSLLPVYVVSRVFLFSAVTMCTENNRRIAYFFFVVSVCNVFKYTM